MIATRVEFVGAEDTSFLTIRTKYWALGKLSADDDIFVFAVRADMLSNAYMQKRLLLSQARTSKFYATSFAKMMVSCGF